MSTIMLADHSATILLSISKILAKTADAVEKASHAAGASGWLGKPATADELLHHQTGDPVMAISA